MATRIGVFFTKETSALQTATASFDGTGNNVWNVKAVNKRKLLYVCRLGTRVDVLAPTSETGTKLNIEGATL